MPKKLVLVDGLSLIYRAFHALPLLDDGSGQYTNAVYGFFSMFLKALADEKPDYVAVAFDRPEPTFRHQKYPEYKGTRAPMPVELVPQIPLVAELLGAMGVRLLTLPGFEADDLLGTVSLMCENAGVDALLVTGDRDAFQLAGEHTQILYTKRGITDTERVSRESLREKYNLEPEQLIDVKALMGDSSDNIPGVPGVGEKTALKLILQYGALERVLETADAEQKGKLRERLMEFADQARLSKWLAAIDRNAPLELELDSLVLGDLSGGLAMMEKLKLRTLLDRVRRWNDSVQKPEVVEEPRADESPATLKSRADDSRAIFRWAVEALRENPSEIALAIEPGRVSIATDRGRSLEIAIGGDLIAPGVSQEEALEAIESLLSSNARKVVCGYKALLKTLDAAKWVMMGDVHDVSLAAYLINPQRASFSMEGLLKEAGYENALPSEGLLLLAREQQKTLQQDGLESLYREMELPLARVLYDMECAGFLVDDVELNRLGAQYAAHIESLTARAFELVGHPFNMNSPKQLGELLFGELGLEGGRKTKTGYSTTAELLEQIADKHPVIPIILEYRKYQKLNSTYVEALLRLRSPDGRIRTRFDQTATATGRISSEEPNLQNIPIRTEMGREIRRAFVAPPGWVLVDADYSQIELRVLAHMSGDAVMREAFQLNQDIHTRTAAEVYGVSINEVTPAMRSAAKAVNFGIVYGISVYGLARNTGVTRERAAELIDRYFERYPGIKRFMDETVAQGKLQGYVSTLLGRRRYLLELSDANHSVRSFGERAAMNSPIQGTAADIIKKSMVRVHDALREGNYRARLILQVHDELIVESPPEEAEAVQALLRDRMENAIELSVPLRVDVSVGGNWNECK